LGIGNHYGIALNVLSFQQNTQICVIKITSTTDNKKKPNALTLQMDPMNLLLPSYSYPNPAEVCLLVYL
jgi:hypothetical protein